MKKTSRLRIAALTAMILGAFSAAFATGRIIIEQKDLSFGHETITVKQGDVIEFTNTDMTSHNIIISGEGVSLNSGLQQPNITFSAPMMKKGIFDVTCGIHPRMKMKITVK